MGRGTIVQLVAIHYRAGTVRRRLPQARRHHLAVLRHPGVNWIVRRPTTYRYHVPLFEALWRWGCAEQEEADRPLREHGCEFGGRQRVAGKTRQWDHRLICRENDTISSIVGSDQDLRTALVVDKSSSAFSI